MKQKANPNIWIGIGLVLLSYFSFVTPPQFLNLRYLTVLMFVFIIGIIIICENITVRLANTSLLHTIRQSRRNTWMFIIVSTAGAVVMEIIVHWLGKLWIYPYYPGTQFYLASFVPGFAVYWLFITESYLATKAVTDYIIDGKKIVTKYFDYESWLYPALAIIGLILILFSGIFIYNNFMEQTSPLFSARDIFSLTSNYITPFRYLVLISLGLWFILEYIEYREKRTSLLKDILHHYPSPVISIFLGSLILAMLMETQNFPVYLWKYINVPFSEQVFIAFPLVVYFGWVIHYVFFLSLFRVFNDKESREIWRGDRIK